MTDVELDARVTALEENGGGNQNGIVKLIPQFFHPSLSYLVQIINAVPCDLNWFIY